MSKRFCIFCLSFFFLLVHARVVAQVIPLRDWSYRQHRQGTWKPAQVPGVVQLDLMREGKIPDPFIAGHEQQMQWVGESDWLYQCRFTCDEPTLAAESLELLFEGLDTYARVYLNDTLILEADNMFRSWSVEVKTLLKRKNILLVHFSAAEARAKKEASHLSYTLPEGWRSFTRKAQYQYGWDWAPKILTCGIWKPVSLVARGRRKESAMEKPGAATPAELISFRVKQLADSSALTKAQASVRIWSAGNRKATLLISCKGFPTQVLHEVNLRKGSQEVLVPFLFPDAKKWEISGRGEPHLYTFQCTLAADQSDTLSSVTGFRDAALLRFPDSTGESFGFRINGRDVFARGANLVPPDVFPSRVPDSVYHALVTEAKAAGMNMLRVWGGGYYLPDVFYDYCDRYGIMVWQDFMFACSMVPGDSVFLENVRREALEQVDRLSRHPSIVLWCGNNESDEGWHNWGWQKQYAYTPADSAKIWKDYQTLFHGLLPAVIDSLDPGRPYLPSSPVWGWGRKESMQRGDSHYWGVWWGMEPFEAYRKKTGRFMSEYGFQSLPAVSAWKGVADTLSITARSLRHHQKHPRGFETISHYLENYFGVPADFGDYSYVSQLQQSYGMKIAMNAHRGHYPTCRGSLFWQWNDCWPSVSWSALDYRLQRKLFYYEAKRAFDSLFVYTDAGERGLSTTVHFDGVDDVSLTIRLYYIRTDRVAEPVSVDERSIRLKPDSILRDCIFYPANQMRNMDSTSMVFVTEAISNFTFSTLYRDYYHRCAPKNLKLLPAQVKIQEMDAGSILLSSDVFAYGVYLFDEEGICRFSDNGFHLLPGERKVVDYSGDFSKIRWKCYNNVPR